MTSPDNNDDGGDHDEPDVFGQTHPTETPSLLRSKLAEFTKILQKTTTYHNNTCHDDAFLLLFLRAEVFDVPLAVKRYHKYWDQRKRVFPNNTIALTLPSEHRAAATHFLRPLPHLHDSGRAVLHFRPALLDASFQHYTRKCVTRVFWHVLHTTITSSESVQRRGIIILTDLSGFSYHQFDRTVVQNILKGMQGAIPMRMAAHFVCYPPTFLQWILPLVLPLVTPRLRKRIQFTFGRSPAHMVPQLAPYGLTGACLPPALGGTAEWEDTAVVCSATSLYRGQFSATAVL